jgi:cytochrome c553
MMKKTALVLAGACSFALSASAWSQDAPKGDADAGRTKNSMCIGCHGIEMYRTAFPQVYSVPFIAGQSPQYIMAALREYRAGERSHPSMTGVAKGLSDQDIADLAAYYGGNGGAK